MNIARKLSIFLGELKTHLDRANEVGMAGKQDTISNIDKHFKYHLQTVTNLCPSDDFLCDVFLNILKDKKISTRKPSRLSALKL